MPLLTRSTRCLRALFNAGLTIRPGHVVVDIAEAVRGTIVTDGVGQ
jgi:hypothetical protein